MLVNGTNCLWAVSLTFKVPILYGPPDRIPLSAIIIQLGYLKYRWH